MWIQLRDTTDDQDQDTSTVRQYWIKADLIELEEGLEGFRYLCTRSGEWLELWHDGAEGWRDTSGKWAYDFCAVRSELIEGCREGLNHAR